MTSNRSNPAATSAHAENARSVFGYMPIGSVFPDPNNPRKYSRDQVQAMARSLSAFGFNAPLLADKNNRIVAGHRRWEAAKSLGIKEVPVVRLEHLSEAQAKAYMLADNKLNDRSSFDDVRLALCLKELQELSLEFDIEDTGFTIPEIDRLVLSLEQEGEDDAIAEFRTPEGPAISRLGDLWCLGPHRLLNGDALSSSSYNTLLGAERAAALVTDPPFNVKIQGHVSGNGRKTHREFAMASGEMSQAQFTGFLSTFLRETCSRMDATGAGFMFMDWRHMGEALAAINACGCEVINLCVWDKGNGGMGSFFRSAHELIFVFRARGFRHRNNIQLGRHGRNRTNVWHYPGMNNFAAKGRASALNNHPTSKPVAMVADAILDVTKPNDIICDPFCGSGTAILAAERTGRRGFGIELDSAYVDLSITRWQRATGQLATHVCGKTFSEISEERGGVNGEA